MMSKAINIIADLRDGLSINDILSPFGIYSFFLKKEFEKKGYECNVIKDRELINTDLPIADYSLIVSGSAMHFIYTPEHKIDGYLDKIRKSTKKYVLCYANQESAPRELYFDFIFTQIKPEISEQCPKHIYAGWGADHQYCYPNQKEKAVYLDSLPYGFYSNSYNNIYDTYKRVLNKSNCKLYFPRESNASKRISWIEIQKIMRKCHYYCCTQYGEAGLSRLEAATCGALLVIPRVLYKKRTMDLFEHKIWDTEEDLIEILNSKTDIEKIRSKASVHTWDKVVKRIISILEN